MTVVLVPNESMPPAPGTTELADVVLDRLSDLDLRRSSKSDTESTLDRRLATRSGPG